MSSPNPRPNRQKIFTLEWQLTSKTASDYCRPEKDLPNRINQPKEEMTLKQSLGLVEKFSEYLKKKKMSGVVILTGGDPFLKMGFSVILKKLQKANITALVFGKPDLIDHETAEELFQKGVSYYQLELGEIGKNFGRGTRGVFPKKICQAVGILKQHGINVGVSCGVSLENYQEFEDIVENCAKYGVNALRLERFVLKGNPLTPNQYRQTLARIYKKINYLFKKNIAVFVSSCDPLTYVALLDGSATLPFLIRNDLEGKNSCRKNFLAVSPDGTLRICKHFPVILGNILEKTFEQMEGAPVISKVRSLESFAACEGCPYLKACRGGCPAAAGPPEGDYFDRDPRCWVDLAKIKEEILENRISGFNGNSGVVRNKIFSPLKIASLTVKNRVFRSATLEGLSLPDGSPSKKLLELYWDLAKGDCGLVITGITYISEDSKINRFQNGIHEDRLVAKWKKITDKIHSAGGKIAMQLTHQAAGTPVFEGELMSPSAFSYARAGATSASREMSVTEIRKVIRQFQEAIFRAYNAGFDAVQLQLAHSYLLCQFLSPVSNKRSDQWGGKLENRIRIIKEIVEGVRERIGFDYPIMAKINCSDFVEEGLDPLEVSEIIKLLAGFRVSAFELSGGTAGVPLNRLPVRSGVASARDEECYYQEEGEFIRKRTPGIILGICGGIRSAQKMEELLGRGFDFVALSRPFIREPDLVRKMKRDAVKKAECVSCSTCFVKIKKSPLECYLNLKSDA